MQAICKQEAAQRPCPRTILVCCTALVTGGLYHEDLFKEEAPQELVHYLLGAFEEGRLTVPCLSASVRTATLTCFVWPQALSSAQSVALMILN